MAEHCPECSGRIVHESASGERVCADCGLVVESEEIDHGPEWRAGNTRERDRKSRVGAPTTQMMHDKGLATKIGWQDQDSYGNDLSSKKRRQLSRLRTWNERFRTRDSNDRNLQHALGEIDRMASALGIPTAVRETSSVLYREALDAGLLPGRSIEAMATASLYAAARIEDIPRSLDEVATVSRVEKTPIRRGYMYLCRELDLTIAPTSPLAYVGRFASNVDCRDETERQARQLLEVAIEEGLHSGKNPVGLAAGALYAAGQLTGEGLTQATVSDATDTSRVTIRNRYPEILECNREAGTL